MREIWQEFKRFFRKGDYLSPNRSTTRRTTSCTRAVDNHPYEQVWSCIPSAAEGPAALRRITVFVRRAVRPLTAVHPKIF